MAASFTARMARLSRSKIHMGMGLFWKMSTYPCASPWVESGARAGSDRRSAGPGRRAGLRRLVATLLPHQPADGGILLHGPTDVVSLRQVAADVAQRAQGLAALDTFRHEPLAEAVGETQHRID